ncbi:MAG: cbb3-type cytochrome c oxidase subunit I, partial [Candidatus Eremiobacteraeota bacterium]|nr:cbb3-type cytochrome c oxidase subunit I [Candidatus Eremiobacteraeota bacterium]
IGARDVAFPRLNAFSYWTFLFGSILINVSWFYNAAPNGSWVGYPPLSLFQYSQGHNYDFWLIGLQILGVASVVGSLNFLTTIINMRAPGMTMMRLPVFVWMTLVTNFLIVLAFPVITIALAELMFDRTYATNFFNPMKGGLPIWWQHLFWVFGHPEVYILILPPMGIVSEVLPTFARRPLFGYPLVVGSGIAIGFMGFTVWAHHMFASGMGNIANAAFALTTMTIAVPTGVKIINWVGTLWKGQIRMRTPMLFSLGFIYQFMMGGFSGLMHANAAHDAQQHDTYFIVAHFHYVLIGGALFGLWSGIYYWYPKFTGRMLNEGRGHAAFWFLFIGFNTTFFPMHWLGLNGMPRRIYSYSHAQGWDQLNFLCTCGAFTMAVAVLLLFTDMFWFSLKNGEKAGNDPWDGRTLEWTIPSPPPVYNFDEIPQVKALDDFWITKHPELLHHEDDEATHPAGAGHGAGHVHHDDHGIHMPGGSWMPMVASAGIAIGGWGLVHSGGMYHVKEGIQSAIDAATKANISWDQLVGMAQQVVSTKAPDAQNILSLTSAEGVLKLQACYNGIKVAIVGGVVAVLGIFLFALEPIGGYYIHKEKEEHAGE